MRTGIARHRAERPREWETVEEPLDVAGACRRLTSRVDWIVLDCLTVWVANLLDRGCSDAAALSDADEVAAVLGERRVAVIVVSQRSRRGCASRTEIGRRFRDLLGAVNQRVAAAADLVTLMVAGIPVPIKRPPLGGRRAKALSTLPNLLERPKRRAARRAGVVPLACSTPSSSRWPAITAWWSRG